MHNTFARIAVAIGVIGSPVHSFLHAQGGVTCRPGAETNESKLLVFYSGPIVFSPGATPERLAAGAVRLSFEAAYVPSPADDIRQPQACYGLEKTEHTELSLVFPRPRLAIGLGAGFSIEGSYLPPITVADATPNLGSVALAHTSTLATTSGGMRVDLSLRAHGTYGHVRGAITCPKEALQQVTLSKACFGTSPSKDTFRPNMYGGDAALAFGGGEHSSLSAYLGGGVLRLTPRFRVGFQQSDGFFDDTPIEVNLTKASAFAGGTWRVLPKASLSAEVYSIPGRIVTGRVGATWMLR